MARLGKGFRIGRIDYTLLILVVALTVFGIVMIFSASYYRTIAESNGPYYFLRRAAGWSALGLCVMVGLSFLPTTFYKRFAPHIMAFSFILLLLLFTPLVQVRNSARRWLGVGELTVMPGEIVKLAAIIFLAWYYTKYGRKAKNPIVGVAPIALLTGIIALLIYKQPNLSTAIIVALLMLAIMFLAGVRWYYIALVVMIGAGAAYVLITTGEGMHMSRIMGYWDPFADAQGDFYQVVQGLVALGSGGLFGAGLGNSVEKALYLPFAENDYIFAVVGEETGFVGCMLMMLGFLVLIWRCVLISIRAQHRFDMLLGAGISALMAIQVVLNIGVVTNLLPPTGVTLPFISYGGNAVVMFMIMMGIMLRISRNDPAAHGWAYADMGDRGGRRR